jgi:drug/metabolite transporter (DMT)-like permease
LLGENLTVPKVVGGMLVISGAVLAQVRFRKARFRSGAGGRPR